MGKASKWLKGLFGFKKPEPTQSPPARKRWSFGRSHGEKGHPKSQNDVDEEAGTRAGGGISRAAGRREEERAAVVIQSHFRAYLSRRALQALKAVVKLQALIRGQLLRKQYVNKLKAIATRRAFILNASSSPLNIMGQVMQERLDYTALVKQKQRIMHKKNRPRSKSNVEKILEADDTWKPKHKLVFHSPHLSHSSDQYYQSFSTPIFHLETGHSPHFSTAENSPQYYSASSMGAKSGRSRNYLSSSSDSPSYMAYTQSSKAKVRSLSAPKHKPQNEGWSSVNRYYVHQRPDKKKASTGNDFSVKPYPGSGHLDKHGMPVRDNVSGYNKYH